MSFSSLFHSYDGSDLTPPTWQPAGTSFNPTSGSTSESDQQQLSLVFLDNNDCKITGATWKPSAATSTQTVTNIPITQHYLVANKYAEPYDVLKDEIVFNEIGHKGPDKNIPLRKLGLSAINRWLNIGGNGYEVMKFERTMRTFMALWACRGIQITTPKVDDTSNGSKGKSEAVIVANSARTMNIWCFQACPSDDSTANGVDNSAWWANGPAYGDHLFLVGRRAADKTMPIYSAQRRLVNLQDPTFHWEIVPVSHAGRTPPEATYTSYGNSRDSPSWTGMAIHVGYYQQTTMRASNDTEKNFPVIAKKYLFAQKPIDAFNSWRSLQKIEVVMRMN
jgi:hypothetical protein